MPVYNENLQKQKIQKMPLNHNPNMLLHKTKVIAQHNKFIAHSVVCTRSFNNLFAVNIIMKPKLSKEPIARKDSAVAFEPTETNRSSIRSTISFFFIETQAKVQ